MEKLTMLLVAPPKLKGIKDELENMKSYQNQQVFIEIVNVFEDLKRFNSYAENFSDTNDVIFIFESITEARVNMEKAQSELLEDIRKIKYRNYEAKIIVILQTEKEKDLSFVNELMKLDVQNFYFANTFSIDDIGEWIFGKSKILKDNLKYVNATMKRPEKEIITKEVTKYVEVPISSTTSHPATTQQDKKSKTTESKTYVIGIIGMSEGTGATSLCVALSEHLARQSKKVLILDRTDNKHLSMIQISGQEIRADTLSDIEVKNYDFVVIDFGTLAHWNADGFTLKTDMTNEKKLERNFCNTIILVGSCLPWKLREAMAYMEEPMFVRLTKDWLFYFTGEKNKPFHDIKKRIETERATLVSFEEENVMKRVEQYVVYGKFEK